MYAVADINTWLYSLPGCLDASQISERTEAIGKR